MSCVEESENVAVAVNCCVTPKGMFEFVGVISKDAITANVAEPEMLPDEAVIVIFILPALEEVVNMPVLLIDASVVSEELHTTEVVRSCFVPFEYVPVAVNCCVAPEAMIGFAGVTAMEERVAERVPDPPLEPPPLQLVTSKRIGTRKNSLFNFIDTNSWWYQGRCVGTALQVPHMSPFFHNDTVCFQLNVPAARLPASMNHGFLILRRIGSKERRQIGMGHSIPDYAEDYSGRRHVFPDSYCFRSDFMDGISRGYSRGFPHGQDCLLVRCDRVNGFAEGGLGLLGGKDDQEKTEAEQHTGEHSYFHDDGILLCFKNANVNAERKSSDVLFFENILFIYT